MTDIYIGDNKVKSIKHIVRVSLPFYSDTTYSIVYLDQVEYELEDGTKLYMKEPMSFWIKESDAMRLDLKKEGEWM